MADWLISLFIGIALGLVLGIKIARDSNKKQPVRGGVVAQVIHYLACSGLTGMLPFIIAGLIVGLPFLVLFGTAVGFLVMTGVFLLLLAVFERAKSSPGAAA
ncbi:MAG: hypothetical protein EHM39_02045 [Chloroflexi bacterium]|nr:MAG: hypothetical protein EHM39_02045 [Chloroflexota bacterium]